MTTTIRTIYVEVADKKTGAPVKGVRLSRLASAVVNEMPRAWKPTYRDDTYIRAGTRFLSLETPHQSTQVLKIRGGVDMRNWALGIVGAYVKVVAVHGYDRHLIGGKR